MISVRFLLLYMRLKTKNLMGWQEEPQNWVHLIVREDT